MIDILIANRRTVKTWPVYACSSGCENQMRHLGNFEIDCNSLLVLGTFLNIGS